MTKETSVVEQWCHDVIYGVGGFHDFETYELFVPEDRDVALVEFALRALAHDVAPTSKEVLESIAQYRAKMSTPLVVTPERTENDE